ncbi:tRNA (adenosine(37)-N6)-dimethylallyltransferase MiaA [Xanthomonas maliensis]|uniref:tRNA (adenosine(37)-N6)-dimethylallyltransferase MiaA n=1 Tax=Xanthomonas maliensis TaxID=1321368 RepID=UPI0003A1CD39|nr:tRNA (adenosine(37)-N6)-dimethylallyltransferase MiaA [Xanthomonas maliensis]KAB7772442.1 tRNA (adenosine(37)-N6)-dimethylallyltransferase MiaA [Xanthomonas maliensis]
MAADRRPLALALMGPTASGKTALALEVAQRWNGEIVSVDSALVYRGLNIGAAKPDAAMRAAVPHHLIDLRDPWQVYSAAEFAHDARQAIAQIVARGKLPILAGGTGLYFRALLDGLAQLPEADVEVRRQIADEAAQHGWTALHAQLAQIDPVAAARIHATDPQRIQRALEVYRISGKPISHWQAQPGGPRLPLRVLKLVLAPRERSVLHARIAARLDAMLTDGLLEEVQRLRALPQMQAVAAPLDLPAVRAVGYRQAWEYLDGAASLDGFRDKAVQATRQLAKRQLTWLRGELDARWFDPEHDRYQLEQALVAFLADRPAALPPSGV